MCKAVTLSHLIHAVAMGSQVLFNYHQAEGLCVWGGGGAPFLTRFSPLKDPD